MHTRVCMRVYMCVHACMCAFHLSLIVGGDFTSAYSAFERRQSLSRYWCPFLLNLFLALLLDFLCRGLDGSVLCDINLKFQARRAELMLAPMPWCCDRVAQDDVDVLPWSWVWVWT